MKKKHQSKLTKKLTLEKRELIVQTDKNFYFTDFHSDKKATPSIKITTSNLKINK